MILVELLFALWVAAAVFFLAVVVVDIFNCRGPRL